MGYPRIFCPEVTRFLFQYDEPPGYQICEFGFSSNNFSQKIDTTTYPECFSVENSFWATFVNVRSIDSILVISDNCEQFKGLEITVFDDNFEIKKCFTVENDSREKHPVPFLEKFQTYHIMIDGIDGGRCKFKLLLSPYKYFYDSIAPITVLPDKDLCPGKEVVMSIPSLDYDIELEWVVSSNLELIDGGGSGDLFARFLVNDYGAVYYDLIPLGACGPKQNPAHLFFVLPIDTTLSRIEVCEKHLPIEIEGITCDTFGGYSKEFVSEFGCDSTVNWRVIQDRSNLTIRDTVICQSDCIPYKDSCYSEGTLMYVDENLDSTECNNMLHLRIVPTEVFSSPQVTFNFIGGVIYMDWESVIGATEYEIIVNQDSIGSTVNTAYTVRDLPQVELIHVKIQPKGNCTYLPAELFLTQTVSNTSSNFLNNKIAVFPNPTNGIVILETDLLIEEIEIYDTSGRFSQKEKTTSFNLKNRAAGIYFLKIKTNEGISIKRILLN